MLTISKNMQLKSSQCYCTACSGINKNKSPTNLGPYLRILVNIITRQNANSPNESALIYTCPNFMWIKSSKKRKGSIYKHLVKNCCVEQTNNSVTIYGGGRYEGFKSCEKYYGICTCEFSFTWTTIKEECSNEILHKVKTPFLIEGQKLNIINGARQYSFCEEHYCKSCGIFAKSRKEEVCKKCKKGTMILVKRTIINGNIINPNWTPTEMLELWLEQYIHFRRLLPEIAQNIAFFVTSEVECYIKK
jgi:hypothetical protein